jgi:hypothetical protein
MNEDLKAKTIFLTTEVIEKIKVLSIKNRRSWIAEARVIIEQAVKK